MQERGEKSEGAHMDSHRLWTGNFGHLLLRGNVMDIVANVP